MFSGTLSPTQSINQPNHNSERMTKVAIIQMFFSKVQTDSSTEFGSNPILIDRIRIESAAGSNPIRRALDREVDFNERVTACTTGRACTPISDIKGGNADIQLRCGPAHN